MNHQLIPVRDAHIDGIRDLINRTNRAENVPISMGRDELVDLLNGAHVSPADDSRVVLASDEVIAYLTVLFRPSGQRQERTFLHGTVDIEHRRLGIGSALLEFGISRSVERLNQTDNDLPRAIQAESYPWQKDSLALLAKFGLEPARYFHEMIRALDSLPDGQPNGFEIVAWEQERSNEARLVFNESFRDHWGSTPADEQTWKQWTGGPAARLDLSFMAMKDGKVIGLALNANYPEDEKVTGRRECWIESLGTLRDHRKMGVGSALLKASFHAFAGAGFSHAALGVDTDSPTQADRLYSNLGFVNDRQTLVVERRMDS